MTNLSNLTNLTNKTNRGFTLIELLVAASIFIIVMGITVVTFFGASSYQRRLRNMRAVNQAARGIVETISRDIKTSSGPVDGNILNFKFTNDCSDSASSNDSDGVLIQLGETKKCYYFIESEQNVYFSQSVNDSPWSIPQLLNSGEVKITDFNLSGAIFEAGSKKDWPYLDIEIKVRNRLEQGTKANTIIELNTEVIPRDLDLQPSL